MQGRPGLDRGGRRRRRRVGAATRRPRPWTRRWWYAQDGTSTWEYLGAVSVVIVVLAMVTSLIQHARPAIEDDVRAQVCRVLQGGTGCPTDAAGDPVETSAEPGAVVRHDAPPAGADTVPPEPGPAAAVERSSRLFAARSTVPATWGGSRAYPTTSDAADHYGQNRRRNLGGTVVVGIAASISSTGAHQLTTLHGCAQGPRTSVDAVDRGERSHLCRLNDGQVVRCHVNSNPGVWTALLPQWADYTCFTADVPADLVVCPPQSFADDVLLCRYAYPAAGYEQSVLRCSVTTRAGAGPSAPPTRYRCSDTDNDLTGSASVDVVNASRRCVAAGDDPTGLGAEICEHEGQLYRCEHTGSGNSNPVTNPVESCGSRTLGIGALQNCGTPADDSVLCPWGDGLVRCYTPATDGPGGVPAAGKWGLFQCRVLTVAEVAERCGSQAVTGRRTLADRDAPSCDAPLPGNGSPLATNPQVTSTRTLPARTYRGDTRPPGQIFSAGFTAWGSTYDLEEYVTRNADSGYVGSSDSQPVGEQFAMERAKQNAFRTASDGVPDQCPAGSAAVAALALLCVTPSTSGPQRASCAAALGAAVSAVLCDRGRSQRLVTVDTYVYEIDPHVAANMLYVPDNLLDPVHTQRYSQQREWASVHHIAPGAVVGATKITVTYALDGLVPRQVGTSRTYVSNPNRTHVRDSTWRQGSDWDDGTAIHTP